MDLLVIAFFSLNMGHFSLKSLYADLVLVEKVRMVAICWLFSAFLARFLDRLCRLRRCVRAQFSGTCTCMSFSNSPLVCFLSYGKPFRDAHLQDHLPFVDYNCSPGYHILEHFPTLTLK